MMKKIKSLFLLLMPALAIGLPFVLLSQQNIFATDDSDCDIASIRMEAPIKHLNCSGVFSIPCIFNERYGASILTVVGDASVYNPLSNRNDNFHSIKNRSPPGSFYL